jgi:hypothetical protein
MQSFFSYKVLVRFVAPLALPVAFLCTVRASAQAAEKTSTEDHIVNSQAMQQQVVTAAEARQKNIRTLTDAFDSPVGQKAMHRAKVDPVQVKNVLPTLSDAELANLSGRVTKAQSDFSAGVIGEGMLLIIILIVILIVVVAAVH